MHLGAGGAEVIFDILGFALCSEDFKRGPYLPSKLLEVIYPWDSHQLPPPVRCVDPMSPSTQFTFCTLLLGVLARDHSPLPLSAWWLGPIGSAQCLTSASVRAPDQGLQRAAQLLGLPQTSILGPGR